MGKMAREVRRQSRSGKRPALLIGSVVTGVVLFVLAWFWITGPGRFRERDFAASGQYARRETGIPLSPALFVGKTARAYQVAWEIPDVLDRLYCYCYCDRSAGHVSLLSCFTDTHGAT